VRTAIAEGLTIVTHRDNEAFFRRLAARPRTRQPDALARSPKPAVFQLVGDRLVLRDRSHEVHLYRAVGNVHAATLLFAWVPRHRILVQADLYADNWARHPWMDNFRDNLARRGLSVAVHAPIHGNVQTDAEVRRTLAAYLRAVRRGLAPR
jgi:hypothetical protein